MNEEEEPMVSFSASPDRDKGQREKSDTAKTLAKVRRWSWALLDLVSARANLRRTNCMYPFREHVERTGMGWGSDAGGGGACDGQPNTFTVLEL